MYSSALAAVLRSCSSANSVSLGTFPVTEVTWSEEAGLLRLQMGDAMRLQVRPSGTEPKVKLYGEGINADPAALLDQLAVLLTA